MDNPENRLKIFISYETKDANLFKISELVSLLEKESKIIEKVYYWERDAGLGQEFKEYMKNNIKNSDLILFFCSERALQSEPVKKEIMYSEAFDKKGVPIFIDNKFVPKELETHRGVQFLVNDVKSFSRKLLDLLTMDEGEREESLQNNDDSEDKDNSGEEYWTKWMNASQLEVLFETCPIGYYPSSIVGKFGFLHPKYKVKLSSISLFPQKIEGEWTFSYCYSIKNNDFIKLNQKRRDEGFEVLNHTSFTDRITSLDFNNAIWAKPKEMSE